MHELTAMLMIRSLEPERELAPIGPLGVANRRRRQRDQAQGPTPNDTIIDDQAGRF